MMFKLGFIFTLALATCMAEPEGYPSMRPNDQLPYDQGYSYQDPRDQSVDDGISGVAGKDYPIFREVPQTRFECEQQQYPGYYADPEAECQAFHICQRGGRKDSFLCPNGTLFNQPRLVCEWWYNVDCSRAPSFYSINEAVAKAMEEADRRIQLAAEEKLSQGYQRGPNVDAGKWNKYNQQNVKQGWNDTPARRNPTSDFAKDLSYGAPEFSAKFSPSANNRGDSYSPEQGYKTTGANRISAFAKDLLTYGAPSTSARPVYGAPELSAKYLPSANNQGNSYSSEQNFKTNDANRMSDFAKDQSYRAPATSASPVYGAPELSAKYLPSANNQGNSYSPEQNFKTTGANRMSGFAKDLTYDAPSTSARPVYGAPELSAKYLPSANNQGNSYSPEQGYKTTGANRISGFAKDLLTYGAPSTSARPVYGAPELSAKYLPSANNQGNSYSPEQNFKTNGANRISDFAKNRSYGAPATSASPVYGAPELSAKYLPSANNQGNSYSPEQNYVITDAKFAKQTTNSNFAEPANTYLPA